MRTRLLLGACLLGLVGLTGCGPTFADLPLPGNGVSGDTVDVKVRFDEALNLSRGAAVKVNGVASGKVRKVTVEDFKAVAVLQVRTSAKMRANATARLRYTTPLGELFVDVHNPTSGAVLKDGQALDPKRSTTAPTVEDALSSASLLVNGGGLNQLQTVTDQLNQALGGREDNVRELLGRANTFLEEANATTPDIDRAMRALADVSVILNKNRAVVRQALHDLAPAARVLRENTPGFTELLAKVTEFSGTANQVVGQTREQILQLMHEVSPVLQEFLDNRGSLGPSLTDLVSVGKLLDKVVPGDYVNLRLVLEMDSFHLPNLLGPGGGGSTGAGGNGSGGLTSPLGGATGTGSSNPLGDLLSGLLGGGGSARTTSSAPPAGISALLGGAR